MIIAQNDEVEAADVGISGNLLLLGNALVTTSTDEDFFLAAKNATCIQNETFNGVVFVFEHAFSISKGAELWTNVAVGTGCGLQPSGFSVGDWNGDGFDDIVHQFGVTRRNNFV